MARFAAPAKNNIYSVLIVVTTIVFLIGFIMNVRTLNKDYKKVVAGPAPSTVTPEIVDNAPQAEADAGTFDLDNF